MHAVVISVTVNNAEAATENLRSNVVPMVSQAPGFVAGYWTRISDDQGRGVIVFESEDGARAVAERIEGSGGGNVTFDSVDVGEVIASA